MDDFIRTIAENDEVEAANESTDSEIANETNIAKKKKKLKKFRNIDQEFNEDFQFIDQDDEFDSWVAEVKLKASSKTESSLDEKIAKIRKQNKKNDVPEDDVMEYSGDEESESSSEDETDKRIDKLKTKEKRGKKANKTAAMTEDFEEEKIQYDDEILDYDKNMSFDDMNLSRPLLKALTHMKFKSPTPIQAATVPVALKGKDICACAATGTGKTAAFMLPILERLLYKPKQAPVTRVLILSPTRELAVQIHTVARQLAQFTNVDISLSAGGLDVKSQEAALRLGPDVVIATPGRLIDHLHNSLSFNLNSVEILVLDEADRMLDEYFAEQMKEVIRLCSRQRQTMLFSATMTEAISDLAAVTLNKPIKIFVNRNSDVALNLRQEFIRVRPNREDDREAILAALVKRTFREHCLVFIQTKRQAHRMHIVLGLLGIKVAELHGNLSQPQRLEALKKFKDGDIDVLLATDLAARGLDIPLVKTVVNFTMPNSLAHYIHRVGRTARAGKSGRSVSLVGEKERKMLKDIIKKAQNTVKSRVIPHEVIERFKSRIAGVEKNVGDVMRLEREEKEMKVAEGKVKQVEKKLAVNGSEDDGMKRTWFQTHQERQQEKAALRLGDIKLLPKNQKTQKIMQQMAAKKVQLTPQDRIEYEQRKAAEYAARSSKRDLREKRLRAIVDDDDTKQGPKKKRRKSKAQNSQASFTKQLSDVKSKSVKKFRRGADSEEHQGSKAVKNFKKKGGKFKSKTKHKRR